MSGCKPRRGVIAAMHFNPIDTSVGPAPQLLTILSNEGRVVEVKALSRGVRKAHETSELTPGFETPAALAAGVGPQGKIRSGYQTVDGHALLRMRVRVRALWPAVATHAARAGGGEEGRRGCRYDRTMLTDMPLNSDSVGCRSLQPANALWKARP